MFNKETKQKYDRHGSDRRNGDKRKSLNYSEKENGSRDKDSRSDTCRLKGPDHVSEHSHHHDRHHQVRHRSGTSQEKKRSTSHEKAESMNEVN